MLASDFGDAPFPYPTLAVDSGAAHILKADGPRLGGNVDTEPDGMHSLSADADDISGDDDEDGVTFGTIQVGSLDAQVTVNVQNAPGKLDAWIDFDGDGNWGGPNERIADSLDVVIGDNTLRFDVPPTAVPSTSFARFRVSTSGALGVSGQAVDGEVEDHRVTLIPPTSSGSIFTHRHLISDTVDYPVHITTKDLDGDGDLDILGAASQSNKVVWLENLGTGQYAQHDIGVTFRAIDVAAEDIDGDGDVDVFAVGVNWTGISWFENDGNQNFDDHYIATPGQRGSDVELTDLDGDGDYDLLASFRIADGIAWFENNGSEGFAQHDITMAVDGPVKVAPVDLDSDGDLDFLVASGSDNTIAWYENNGSQVFTEHVINGQARYANNVAFGDLDSDGDIDVVSSETTGDRFLWYENDGAENFSTHVIGGAYDAATGISAMDFDGDGDLDLLGGAAYERDIMWFENDGNGFFVERGIASSIESLGDVLPADIDGDGDLDVLISSLSNNTVAWYENRNIPVDFGDAPASYLAHADRSAFHHALGPTLGATRDSEAFAIPSVSADGDGDDEDGVTFTDTLRAGMLDGSVVVHVKGGSAKLDAWIDLNGDGSWGGPGEQIATSLDVMDGDNRIEFDIPADANAGETFARFRISTKGGLGVGGFSEDGEVEDHPLFIHPPALSLAVFAPGDTINVHSSSPLAMATGDMDGDGDPDIVAASSDDLVVWYENVGNEQFVQHIVNEQIDRPSDLEIVDVDDDGDLDFFVTSYLDNQIAWYENDGGGEFEKHEVISDQRWPWSISTGDLDGDGDLDFAAAMTRDGTFLWFENDGSESFTSHTLSSSEGGARRVAIGDLDDDGDLDVVALRHLDDSIVWFRNDDLRVFSEHVLVADQDQVLDLILTDLDEDGDLDIAIANSENAIRWFENDGALNFTQHVIAASAVSAYSMRAEDLDHDGDLDLIAAFGIFPTPEDSVAWYENDGSENFSEHIIDPNEGGARSVAAADFNGDGSIDVVAGTQYQGSMRLYSNDGDQNFASRIVASSPGYVTETLAYDLDGDGDLDVVGATNSNRISWYENTGSQYLQEHVISWNVDHPKEIAVADLDNDGDADVVSVSLDSDVIAWHENDGSQNFTHRVISTDTDGPSTVDLADIDADGDLDIVIGAFDAAQLYYFDNDGNQNFTRRVVGNIAGLRDVTVADLNRDGRLNVIYAGPSSIGFLRNNGVGLVSGGGIGVPGSPTAVHATDINGDGLMDVLTSTFSEARILWMQNNGDGSFTEYVVGTGVRGARDAFPGDFDGDGDVDVIAAAGLDDTALWFENDGNESFTPHVLTTEADNVDQVFAGDLDSDGDLDLFSASQIDGRIRWFENTDPDFGDAPAPYPTLRSGGGAWHDATGPQIGRTRDIEADGVVSDMADADTDDGVLFGAVRSDFEIAGVNIDLQNSDQAVVNAWMDFDQNGAWEPDEQILVDRTVFAGLQTLNFSVPTGIASGTTFARVRVSSEGGLAPTGFARDGEVEDYAVEVDPPPGVEIVVINDGSDSRSHVTAVTVTFNTSVDQTLLANAFTVTNLESGVDVGEVSVSATERDGKTTARLSFAGASTNLRYAGNSLADGNYRLRINPDLVVSTLGRKMSDEFIFGGQTRHQQVNDDFFRLFGDSDGDGDVDGLDYGRFAVAFLRALGDPGYDRHTDFDGDGDADGRDYIQFGQRFLSRRP